MDIDNLLAGARAGYTRSDDTPDFSTLMRQHGVPAVCPPAIGASPTIAELCSLICMGSIASSLDELPRSILQHLLGFGVLAVEHMLKRLEEQQPSELLSSVLHLPLKKKDPGWLLRNSRPVLLEPFLRRCEATAVPSAELPPPRFVPSSKTTFTTVHLIWAIGMSNRLGVHGAIKDNSWSRVWEICMLGKRKVHTYVGCHLT